MNAPKTLRYQDQVYVRADYFADGSRGTLKCPGAKLSTDGSGYWSRQAKPVKCLSLQVGSATLSDDTKKVDFAELRVFFDPESWNVKKDGLIYTDRQWLKELRAYLTDKLKFSTGAVRAMDYSEQGMQGNNYVSLDVKGPFIKEWDAHTPNQPKKVITD